LCQRSRPIQTFPRPVFDKNLLGHIAARDVGDARVTNHYYAFRGTPGDLLITVQSRNLNGDIDVFTLGTLRPLLKLTIYAENTAPITKGIYLRKTEDLLLRVQARSPNDEEGTYELTFAGSFLAIEGGSNAAESAESTEAAPASGGGRRASSVGARINEPPPPLSDVAVVPAMPEPTPAPTPVESPKPVVTAEHRLRRRPPDRHLAQRAIVDQQRPRQRHRAVPRQRRSRKRLRLKQRRRKSRTAAGTSSNGTSTEAETACTQYVSAINNCDNSSGRRRRLNQDRAKT
jgi:hypothetical protein